MSAGILGFVLGSMARAVVAIALALAALIAAMGWAARAMDAYQLGYEDGKRYMRNLLLGPDAGARLRAYYDWLAANKREQEEVGEHDSDD